VTSEAHRRAVWTWRLQQMEALRCPHCGRRTRPDLRDCARCATKKREQRRRRRVRRWVALGLPIVTGRRCNAWADTMRSCPRCVLAPGHAGDHDYRRIGAVAP